MFIVSIGEILIVPRDLVRGGELKEFSAIGFLLLGVRSKIDFFGSC